MLLTTELCDAFVALLKGLYFLGDILSNYQMEKNCKYDTICLLFIEIFFLFWNCILTTQTEKSRTVRHHVKVVDGCAWGKGG